MLLCNESAAFRTRCSDSIDRWRAEQQANRFHRGLVIRWRVRRWQPRPTWGLGKLLMMAYQLHTLCLEQLRRFCYISLFDTALDAYFGYAATAGPMAWSPSEKELFSMSSPLFEPADTDSGENTLFS